MEVVESHGEEGVKFVPKAVIKVHMKCDTAVLKTTFQNLVLAITVLIAHNHPNPVQATTLLDHQNQPRMQTAGHLLGSEDQKVIWKGNERERVVMLLLLTPTLNVKKETPRVWKRK